LAEQPGSVYSVLTIDESRKATFHPFHQLREISSQATQQSRVLICVADPCSVGDYPGSVLYSVQYSMTKELKD